MMKRGQSAIEFFVLAGAAILFFLAFSIVVQMNITDKSVEQINLQVKDAAFSLQDEVSLASGSSEGYRRDFKIPDTIGGREYNIEIVDDSVYVKTDDGKFAISLPVGEVTGEVQKGDNFIIKENGKVYLNEYPPESEGGFSPEDDEGGENNNFIRGDANSDGVLDISDGIFIDNYLYRGGANPSCFRAADANDDGIINTTDSVYLNNYLFSGGPAPKQPYSTCGADTTSDELSCNSYSPCASQSQGGGQPTPIPTGTPTPTPSATPSPSASPSGS
ncbi:MAG: dockerin type I repeat-containing protein [Nanoarchaeota archaeon]|nr:dockerin type I repeat-containing protein [Nanoarchaeota archaeon]